MAAPRIAIPIPTSFDQAYNHRSWPEYAQAVAASGAEALAVELGAPGLQAKLATCDGIVLPGSGADIAPARYGQELQPETSPADTAREVVDLEALAYAEQKQLPLLAICFGLQSLNVYRGGTLVQHLLPMPVNHRAGRSVTAAHASLVSAASKLGSIVAVADDVAADAQPGFLRTMVNSSHHQAVGIPGERLHIVARSTEDGVVEALEDADHPWLVGVQWHPERTLGNASSRAIFDSFVAAARGDR